MSKLLKLGLGLILFFSFGYWCVYEKSAPFIQSDINNRAVYALKDAGYSSLDVEVKGRDLLLSGFVDKATQRGLVEQIAKVEGVRLVENQITVSKKSINSSNYFLNIRKTGSNTLNLQGYVPDALTHHNFVSYVMETFNSTSVEDHLLEQENPPNGWISISKIGLDGLKQLQSGVLNITIDRLHLTGKVSSSEIRKQVMRAINERLPDNIETVTKLDIELIQEKGIQDIKDIDTVDDVADKTPLSTELTELEITACQSKLNKVLSDTNITFKTSSSEITSTSYPVLKNIVQIKKECPNLMMLIGGHTDSTGNSSFNQQLSERRAIAVKEYLSNAGTDNDKLLAEGFGSNRPITSNKNKKGRKKNRRIEITLEETTQ